ncbi:MAG: hypothetical protein SGJ18_00595 [Pseudomonadota bacterium]|nr:hypothetical protein [Pseudomonadota bacterium]
MATLFLFLLLFFLSLGFAEEKKGEALQQFILENTKVTTTETIVEVGGKKFRKLEVEGKTYSFQLYSPTDTDANLEFRCEKEGYLDEKPRVLVARKVTKRTKLFVEGLKITCDRSEKHNGRGVLGIDPAIQIGFMLPEDPADLIKNKKIYITPFGGAGFYGEW